MPDPTPLKFDIVIAGGGFAGVYCARQLAREFGREAARRVALISDYNFLTFQPMLAEVVGSTVSPRHVVNALHRLCPRVAVLRGSISSLDLESRTLALNAGEFASMITVAFEHLVLALGGVVDLTRVPGMAEHAFLIKNVGDALLLRAAIIDRFEEAILQSDPEEQKRSLTFVIVGGGFSGVEVAGHILDLTQEMVRAYRRLSPDIVRVVLIHSGNTLLPEISRSLGGYCEENLRGRGVEIILNCRVIAVTAGRAKLNDGQEIESHTVVCTVGNAPNPLVTGLCERHGLSKAKGRIVTDAMLRVPKHDRLWAAGDCAAVPLWSEEPSKGVAEPPPSSDSPQRFCPPTAQFATREGRILARNLASTLSDPAIPLQPFTFTGLGELAAIGHRAAVADVMGMKFSGFFAWWLWRTIYLFKLPGLERKLRVALDWTLDLFFPRDIALFQSHPTRLLSEMYLETGDELLKAGEPARSIYVVKAGRIELRDREGKTLRTLSAGDHIGKNTVLAGKGWQFSAIATEASRVVTVDARVFEAVASAGASPEEVFALPVGSPSRARQRISAAGH